MTNSEEEKYDLIERYVNQLLSAEEQRAFEVEMNRDPLLKTEVEAYLEVQELVLDQGILNVKTKLREIHRTETGKINGRNYYLPGAALVIVSATLLYLYFTSADQPSLTEKTTVVIQDTLATQKKETITSEENKTKEKPLTAVNTSPADPIAVSKTQDNPKADKTSAYADPVVSPIPATRDDANTKNTTDTPSPKTDPVSPITKTDCAAMVVSGDVTTSESCSHKATGYIVINLGSLKGGTKPYKYSLEKEGDFQTGSQFSSLEAGDYHVFVKDKNNCISELKKVAIKSKDCPKEYSFAPERGAVWEIPVTASFNGELRILNRANEKVYNSFIKNGSPDTWNGTDQNGGPLPSGIYLFMLISENGEVSQGYVTVLK